MAMQGLTGFQRDLLVIIAGLDEPHGLAVKDDAEEYYEKEIHHGRLYPNLDTLVDEGFVEKSMKDRRTNEYHVTEDGWEALADRREWKERHFEP